MTSAAEQADRALAHYPYLEPLTTRWSDNDQYGHVNNSIYYQYFDAVANSFLIRRCGLVPVRGEPPLPPASQQAGGGHDTRPSSSVSETKTAVIGLVVSSSCRYYASVEFPRRLLAGLSIAKCGKSSVTYRLAIFDAEVLPRGVFDAVATGNYAAAVAGTGKVEAACVGFFTHVFVDRVTRRPTAMTTLMRTEFERVQKAEADVRRQSTAKL